MDDPKLPPDLEEYRGFKLVDFYIVPHYGEAPYKDASETIVGLYGDKLELMVIDNKQAIEWDEDTGFKII